MAALFVLSFAATTGAQPGKRPARIGFLPPTADHSQNLAGLRQGLRDLGYVEGRDIVIEVRDAAGQVERLPVLASELVREPVDLIVTYGNAGIRAASGATKTTPIVVAYTGDLLGTGLVASLARPGGNVTGLTGIAPELVGKRLELLREVVPRLARVAVVWSSPGPRNFKWPMLQDSARILGVSLQSVEARVPADLDQAFAAMSREHVDAALVLLDNFTLNQRTRITDLAARSRIPTIYEGREFFNVGGLVSYGPSIPEMHRQAARYVDKILKGTKPADLPVEQPTRLELLVNLKTAQALGLTIPQSILLRADRVIK